MTIECYVDTCPYHGTNHGDEGPFCDEPKCTMYDQVSEAWAASQPIEVAVSAFGCHIEHAHDIYAQRDHEYEVYCARTKETRHV